MEMELRDVKEYVAKRKQAIKDRIELGLKMRWYNDAPPTLAIIQVGNNEASNRYVRNKMKDCDEVGITAHAYYYPEDTTEFELVDQIEHLVEFYDGVMVQLPLPPHIRVEAAVAAIPKEKDVDGFRCDSLFSPATPLGIVNYLDYCGFDFEGKEVVILGRSDIVGKPLAKMMTDRNATVTLCHSKSKLSNHIYRADLIVSAVGKAGFLNCYPIHCPVVDVGINFVDGKLVGDCYNTEGRNVTPVPGGVGLLTRLSLLENVLQAKEMKKNEKYPY